MTTIYGALPGDWEHFAKKLGLREDLLPVVSNPSAVISPNSKMGGVGKTPSVYNANRRVVGFPAWTSVNAYPKDIQRWDEEADYGICVQTRRLRAIDVDIDDVAQATAVREMIEAVLGESPIRSRSNSPKFLIPLRVTGEDMSKRILRTAHGAIEFLATGQQFIACGTHPSGVRYEWSESGAPGLPQEFPEISAEMFEGLWRGLEEAFAVEEGTTTKATVSRKERLQNAIKLDDTALKLLEDGWVLSQERDGRMHINCPFEDQHTGPSAESSTSYFPANTGGFELGHFKCLHAHCAHRTDEEFREAIGMASVVDDFADLTATAEPASDDAALPAMRFRPVPAGEFTSQGSKLEWLVKGVLPKAELAMVYGPPASGKTFWVMDMVMHIVRGQDWNGKKVRQGQCLYIAAEGANGVRKRTSAYCEHNGLTPDSLEGLHFIADAPRLTEGEDRKALAKAINQVAPVDVIVIDTLAASMPGGDENNGKEVGAVLDYCKKLHKHFGALVILIHHSGKDETKGARGWSGLRGAVDCEIQISRSEDLRAATVTKLKDGDDTEQSYGFRLNVVELGKDEDGDAITSCVVAPMHGVAAHTKPAKDPVERVLIGVIEDAELLVDELAVNDVVEQVIDRLPAPEGTDRRRAKVFKAIENAVADNRVVIHEGYIRLVGG